MLTRLRRETNTENDTHLSDAELYQYLTAAVAETWDALISSGQGDIGIKSVTFNTVAGQVEYPIGTVVSSGDFYRMHTIYVNEGNGQYRPLSRINPYEIQTYKAPNSAVPMKLYYLPVAPTWTTGAESFDSINGWEDHTIACAAIKVKAKKEDSAARFAATKRECEMRMQTMANRNMGEPARIVRKRRAQLADLYAPWRNNVSAYDFRGGNLELYYRAGCVL